MSQYPRPYVAIVGRPNVGKSTLINRILGGRIAIVHDEPGVTRDRAYYIAEWQHFPFTVVDTGGVNCTNEDNQTEFGRFIREQMQTAVEEADYVIFLTDGQTGVTTEDTAIASIIRRLKKPVKVAANKLDSPKLRVQSAEFFELGLGEPVPMTALHGDASVGDILEWVKSSWQAKGHAVAQIKKPPLLKQDLKIPEENEIDLDLEYFDEGGVNLFLPEPEQDSPVRVAFIGRPNVGKSSIVNSLLGEQRGIVSDIAGTTRDSIDTLFEQDGQEYLLVDTAGIRRRAKVDYGVEMFSVDRALQSIHRADVVALVIDAIDGVTHHEKRLAEKIREKGKAIIIIVNKWDLQPEKDTTSTKKYTEKKILPELPHVNFAPVLFVSAKTGQRVSKILETVMTVYQNANRRVQTSLINNIITEAVALSPPKAQRNKMLKVYYATQVSVMPPTFVIFVNNTEAVASNYLKYLERRLRESIEFTGVPLVIHYRNRSTKDRVAK